MTRLIAIMVGFVHLSMLTWAQGAIDFRTFSQVPFVSARVTDSRTGTFLSGEAWSAQLYYSEDLSSSASLRPAYPSTHFIDQSAMPFQIGYVQPVLVVLDNTQLGQTISVQVRAWNTSAGKTYEEAAVNPEGVIGASRIFQMVVGSTTNPQYLRQLRDFSVAPVPEPRMMMLLLLGIFVTFTLRQTCRYDSDFVNIKAGEI